MKKGLKIFLIITGVFVALIAAVLIALSPVATNYVNTHGEELVGRKLSVEKLKINLLTGHVAIHHLKLYEDDGTTEFVTFDTLDVRARLLRLIGKDVYLSHITLVNPHVRLVQDGKRFNFTSLIDHFKSDSDEVDNDNDGDSKWGFYFYNIRLAGGMLYYNDVQRGSKWKIRGVDLEVPGFCIGADEQTDAGLSFQLADGGLLHVETKYNLESNDFSAALDLTDVNLAVVDPYIVDVINVKGVKGTLSAHLKVAGNMDRATEMNITGSVELNDFDLPTSRRQSVGKCDFLRVKARRVNLSDNLFDIDSIVVRGLVSRFDRFEDGTNFGRLVAKKEKTDQDEAPENDEPAVKDDEPSKPSKPLQVIVRHLRFSDGAFAYADHTMPDEFEFPISNISIESDEVNLRGDSKARLRASLPGGGHLDANWHGNLADWKSHQDLFLRIKGLDCTKLTPYTVAYFGRPFTDGTFSFVSHNTVNNSILEGKNHIDIYKAEVGKKRRGVDTRMHVPFKSAIYVLKDKDDKILLDVPIKGNISSPEFNYSKIIWKAIGNVFVKMVASPITAIGKAAGKDNIPEFIKLDPQQRDFTSEQYHQLAELANLIRGNDNVILILEQQVLPTDDEELLRIIERRDQLALQYLTQQEGIAAEQVKVSTKMVPKLKKQGYVISSEAVNVEDGNFDFENLDTDIDDE